MKPSPSSSESDKKFDDEVIDFGARTEELLHNSFGSGCVSGTVERPEKRHSAALSWRVELRNRDLDSIAHLIVDYKLCMDSEAEYLAVHSSSYVLKNNIDRAPMIRWDYDRNARSKPASHIQIAAHRGSLTHVLALTGRKNPHTIESLHLPMGGERARVCLEDVIHFLIKDMRFAAEPGWMTAVQGGREVWRRIQTRTMVRDAPSEAVRALQKLGYEVTPPVGGEREDDVERLRSW